MTTKAALLTGAGAAAFGAAAMPADAQADKLVVKNTRSHGKGSFAHALDAANRSGNHDKIVFASKLSGTIDVRHDLVVKNPVKIDGGASAADAAGSRQGRGDRAARPHEHPADAPRRARRGCQRRAFPQAARRILIRDSVLEGDGQGTGADLYQSDGRHDSLRIENSTIRGFGIGVNSYYLASVDVVRSTITGNGFGITNSTYSGTSITKSTVSNNRSGGVSAGYESHMHVVDSTITGNGGSGVSGDADVYHSTVTDNTAKRGAGIYAYYEVVVRDSIIAGNHSQKGDDDCAGRRLKSKGGNVFGAAAGCRAAGNDIAGVDPKLGPLVDNGGPTKTQLPAKRSPAIDHARKRLNTDQRLFKVGKHEAPDSGAVERDAKASQVRSP